MRVTKQTYINVRRADACNTVKMPFGPPPSTDARAADRRPVVIRAHLREAGGSRMDVDVHDLSRTGFRTDCIYNLGAGARVYLTLPSFAAMEAIVAWRDKNGFGCQFVQPLHPAVLDTIAKRHFGF